MAALPDNDKLILEQAVRWHLWLRDHRAEPSRVEVFQRWCDSNPKHRLAYEQIVRLSESFDDIDALDLPWPTELELSLDQYDGSYALPLPEGRNPLVDEVADFKAATSSDFVLKRLATGKSQRFLSRHWAVAASIAFVALVTSFAVPQLRDYFSPDMDAVYVTGVGKQRVERLEDGSMVTLGGNTRLSVAFSDSQRRIELEMGEAFFEVSKDAGRPFIVSVGESEVKAVGTAFNINKRRQAITVSVLEGVVDVSRQASEKKSENSSDVVQGKPQKERLSKGQELKIDRLSLNWQSNSLTNLERATAWRQGRLAFVNERLDQVIEDVNRYSTSKLVIADSELGDLRYTGTVFNVDIDAWLEGLQQAFAVRVLKVDNHIILVKDNLKKAS